ncbi:class I adenylate-forming enzyme family protein [Actinocorallia longicatena]|uniref:Long-chain fatty acid--CoA ligase n=1 Tax=Actinocorallia longicatena TaxID=111803 RepID=A0ABP6QDX7_9ACTN
MSLTGSEADATVTGTGRPGIAGVLDRALSERPGAVAVVGRSGELTYAELDAAADRAAAAFSELGVGPGDRVAVCLPNDLDIVIAFHGAMRLGAIWTGVGEALAVPEKRRLLEDGAPSIVIALPGVAAELGDRWRAVALPLWRSLVAAAGRPPAVDVDVHAPAAIAYTSGTTGLPRGIVHSQHNLLLPGEVLVTTRGWGPELRKGDCLPLTILNMMVLTTLLTARAGGVCVLMDRRDAEGVAEWIGDHGVTHWNGVAAQLRDLARRRLPGLACLREVWSGGADCPEEVRTAFADAYGLVPRTTYGLTEAPTVVAIDPVGDRHAAPASGLVLGHLLVRALDDAGEALPPGRVGELCVSARPDGPWAGRWRPPLGVWSGGAVEPWPPGPLRTGDLGSVDDDGWLRVVDRRKLVIVRGGANVYPAEIERILLAQPGVTGAVVFGVPDDRLGERVGCLVELDPAATSLEELRGVCSTQLARYKVPERWATVAALPRNAMGKVVRTGLPSLLPVPPKREEREPC